LARTLRVPAALVALAPAGWFAGVEDGVVCLGCCWALMLALLVFGLASALGGRASAAPALSFPGATAWVAL
jgi:hypothetical protein